MLRIPLSIFCNLRLGITWIGTEYFAAANEGDLDGGSRGFTIWKTDGTIVYDSGNMIDRLLAKYGQYQEGRSENKGGEPEGILYFEASDNQGFLVILSERGGAAFLFKIDPADPSSPVYAQILPTNISPEGLKAIPSRNLLVVACEGDERDNKFRAGVNIYQYQEGDVPDYPTLESENRADGSPIPFSALSGLAAAGKLYNVFTFCLILG